VYIHYYTLCYVVSRRLEGRPLKKIMVLIFATHFHEARARRTYEYSKNEQHQQHPSLLIVK